MAEDQVPVPSPSRAQLLATEHWGLLASRSTAQSEVLTRISMFLTLVSAALVSLALVGQATDFSDAFVGWAIGVLVFVSIVGVLTQMRVLNVGMEDLMYVLAMNRLRAAYVDIDPGVRPYLMASPHDDEAGSGRTYYFLGNRSAFSQVGGSSMMFIMVVNSALVGLLVAAIAAILGGATALVSTIGALAGLAYFFFFLIRGARSYQNVWKSHKPVSPSPTA
ncbi:MAG TPA: hypothetical protein VEX88_12085 [Glaciibacter sp.]|nr:hypothetical protein [Glaciibacter sp.]